MEEMNEKRKGQRLKFCNCGKVIPLTEECECKKEAARLRNKRRVQMKPEEKKFFNSKSWKYTRLSVIKRDGGYCQRCLIKYNFVTTQQFTSTSHKATY
ncbi:hypothetical protein [Litchfieldia alkalitelluris]|uniref:hypothetical protein n=1 Tax=Litchfieldia alkalitelluris TaxID=304268 RepID=UPI000998DE62|nr:hypothetical protein [Litchfieldia alkalitelluris]